MCIYLVWDASSQAVEKPSCLPWDLLRGQQQLAGLGGEYCAGTWATELATLPTGRKNKDE